MAPMWMTVVGIDTCLSFVHASNAFAPIEVTPGLIMTLTSVGQLENT